MKNAIDISLTEEELTNSLNSGIKSNLFKLKLNAMNVPKPIWMLKTQTNRGDKNYKQLISKNDLEKIGSIIETAYSQYHPCGYEVDTISVVPTHKQISSFELPVGLFQDENFSLDEFSELMHGYLENVSKVFIDDTVTLKTYPFKVHENKYCFTEVSSIVALKDKKTIHAYIVAVTEGHWHAFSAAIRAGHGIAEQIKMSNLAAYYAHEIALAGNVDDTFNRRNIFVLYDSLYDYVIDYKTGFWGRRRANKSRGVEIPLCVAVACDELGEHDVYVPDYLLISFEVKGETRWFIKQSELHFAMVPYNSVMEEYSKIVKKA